MSASTIDRLAELTSALETSAPGIRGAFPDFRQLAEGIDAAGRPRSVYLLGTIKSGKSTLVNALLGRDLMPRGAGVKTFNLTRAARAPAPRSRVRLFSGEQLRARLAFDFRMLGFSAELPEAPWSLAGAGDLVETLEAFDAACREDERLQAVEADASLLGLLPLSLARVRHTIAGLSEVVAREDTATLERIDADAELVFEGADFECYRDWTRSHDVAALIREIELGVPFPPELPPGLELVDCQGSDSLNPLDFADVDAIVENADLVVYVIQSRLGLRQADRQLLRHLADRGAADRLLAVLNVEAFDAMTADEFAVLEGRVATELAASAGTRPTLLVVNSLGELQRALGEEDELRLMEMLWRKRDAGEVFDRLAVGGEELRRRLAGTEREGGSESRDAVARGLVHRARSLARALLARDRQILGTETGGMGRNEAVQVAQRIVDGERERIRSDLARATDAEFEADAPLAREIDAFLATGATRYSRHRPVPEALLEEIGPARIIDTALATFNRDWLHAEGSERAAGLADLRARVRTRLLEGVERVLKMLPRALRSPAPEDREGADVRRAPGRALAAISDRVPAPQLLEPVVLGATIRHGLAAEFRSRELFGRIGRGRSASDASEQTARRVETLWRRTLQAAFRQAEEDRAHRLASVRENFKFQYVRRIADALLDALQAEVAASVERHHRDLDALAADERLLLGESERSHLAAYLDELDALESATRSG